MKRFLLVSFFLFAGVANAGDLIIKDSPHDVATTMERLKTAVLAKGLTVFSRIDHAAGAKKVGMELPPIQVLIFGNPKLGTLLMQKNPSIGLDLPMKAVVWRDAEGKTRVAYRSAEALGREYRLDPKAMPLAKVKGALAGLVAKATAPD